MCGIAGFAGFNDRELLARCANNTQIHRGPDNQSIWYDDYISFAHQRLSIIDLSDRSNQPFTKGKWLIVYNGEVYNFKELKAELIEKYNSNFTTDSDTEVILEYFIQAGVNCLNKFIGMFAFAIYNTENCDLYLVRDHFGIKPIFYTTVGENFAFASELKTLVSIPGFDKELDFKSLISSLNYLWVSGNDSMFSNTKKLPPGHYLKLNRNGSFEINKYWELTCINETRIDETLALDELNEKVNASIDRHLVADVPVSSFLSGGLDSSLIAVLSHKRNKKLSTYTISTKSADKKIEQMPADEKYSRVLAEKFKFDHNEIEISPDILKLLPRIVRTLDEPIGDPAAINTFLICEAARKKGVKVLLSGMGADEIFFGYRRQVATLYAIRYKSVPLRIRALIESIVDKLPVKIGNRGLKFVRWSKRYLSFASLPTERSYMRSYSYYNEKELGALLKSDCSIPVKQLKEEHQHYFNKYFDNDPVNQMCYTDIHLFMLGLNLTYTDRASMAASVEVRVPFIDREVIEYGMSLSGKLKFNKGESKYLLKKMSEKYLPEEIIYRPKASFGAPIRSWISNELKPLVDDLLSESNVKKRGLFNYDVIKQMIENDRDGIEDNAYRIYQLLTLELWFREFID